MMHRFIVLAAVPVLSVQIAHAQEAGQQAGQSTRVLLEQVVVTATKKSHGETAMDVPLAITALGAEQIEARFVQSLQSLSYDIPNVQLEDVGTFAGYANFSIRGLGINSSIPSIDPTVGVFVDGVYMGINAGVVFDTFDIESVEVLRGPQGVLFGRNVTGGAVLLRTTAPAFDFSSKASVSIESGPRWTASATLTGPLDEDSLAGKLALYYSDDGGWFRNRYDGRSFGESTTLIVRPALAWERDALRVDLRYEHGEGEGDGPPGQNHALFERDSFDFSIDFPGSHVSRWDQASIELNLDVAWGDGVITNVAGYRQYDSSNGADVDATPAPLFNVSSLLDQEQWSNELRYAGRFGSVDVTTGAYYFTQDLRYLERRNLFGGAMIVSGGGTQDQDTWGLFTSLDWHFAESWILNVGGRYSAERKSVQIATLRPGGCDLAAGTCAENFFDDHSWSSVTPKVALQWQLRDHTRLYGSYTRGFRSGGYNLRNTDPGVPPGPFDQETQDSFELGLKQQFGARGRIHLAAFRSRMTDLQREVNLPGPLGVSQVVRNTADAVIDGIEAEAQVVVLTGLVLSGQLGYVDGDYRRMRFDLNGDGSISTADYALELPRLAPWTYGVGLDYELSLGSHGTANARLDYSHRDKVYFTDNNRGFLQGAQMLDASMTFVTPAGRWRFSLYGRNLLDEVTIGGDTLLPTAFGGVGASFSPLNRGRVLGAELTARF